MSPLDDFIESDSVTTTGGNMSSSFYFLIPFLVLTSINLLFLYVLSIDISTVVGLPVILVTFVLLFSYILSKMIIIGNKNSVERAFIALGLHCVFIVFCLISLILGVFPFYIKVFLVIGSYLKTVFFWKEIKPYLTEHKDKKKKTS